MRELKDYFCNETQTQELIKLGLSEKHGISAEQYETAEFGYSGFLRSQALDFFRDLGYEIIQETTKSYICWHVIIKGQVKTYVDGDLLFHVSESLLISKLIELEKEARNGN